MNFVEFSEGRYRLTKELSSARSVPYYRLYERHNDTFGNISYTQIWSGNGVSIDGGILANELFLALNVRNGDINEQR